ncbi:MAG: ferrous iron transport protein A [Cyclobacteriaceae bacterium]|nr:ferrous iron transport protein A [Cyclobacteriaceae bacterium]
MTSGKRSVAQMKPGEVAVIAELEDDFISLKLMEMGCIPGATVRFNFSAPLGDPICISISGYELALRLEEASSIAILN